MEADCCKPYSSLEDDRNPVNRQLIIIITSQRATTHTSWINPILCVLGGASWVILQLLKSMSMYGTLLYSNVINASAACHMQQCTCTCKLGAQHVTVSKQPWPRVSGTAPLIVCVICHTSGSTSWQGCPDMCSFLS